LKSCKKWAIIVEKRHNCHYLQKIVMCVCVCVCVCVIGVWTQDFSLAKQALYHSRASSPFCSGYFWDRILWIIWLNPQSSILLSSTFKVARITGISHQCLAIMMTYIDKSRESSRSCKRVHQDDYIYIYIHTHIWWAHKKQKTLALAFLQLLDVVEKHAPYFEVL
jgi:hypothetical protein